MVLFKKQFKKVDLYIILDYLVYYYFNLCIQVNSKIILTKIVFNYILVIK